MANTRNRETDDAILQEDLDLVANTCEHATIFKNSTVLITGATGYIGSLLVRQFLCLNRLLKLDVKIVCLARSETKVATVFPDAPSMDNVRFIYGNITDQIRIDGNIDYVIHAAATTMSAKMVAEPVELIRDTVMGLDNMLSLARDHSVKGFLFLSSMEAFGRITDPDAETREDSYGYVDPYNVRSCYPESKRMAECLCHCYAKEYGVRTIVARLAQTIGAGIDYGDTRLPAQFARSIFEGTDIVLNTKGDTVRNIVYSRDAVSAFLTLLAKGATGEAYNVANRETAVSVADTASILIDRIAGNSIKLVFNLSGASQYPEPTRYRMNTDKLEKLGWRAEIGLVESYQRMIQSMENVRGKVR
jgi:dTDP-glucose 4,6-dehydratase